jgi:hypothetical protein
MDKKKKWCPKPERHHFDSKEDAELKRPLIQEKYSKHLRSRECRCGNGFVIIERKP